MSQAKEITGYDPSIDPNWTWLEGLRPNSAGKPLWWPLYCFRKDDLGRARGALAHILRKKDYGEPMPDDLDAFSDFRLREAGTPTDAIWSMEEVRNPIGGFALQMALRNSAPRCGVINLKTGSICTLAPGHFPGTRHRSEG